nr:uncharacterized mitochondrial protein AtMg00810-like [Tanacetum cinerariifolium]
MWICNRQQYLKGNPHLGMWCPKDSPFNLVAYSNSNYNGASLDRKSTTGGCHFLGCRLIYWQFNKQTVVATSSTEAEYVATASCCAQVLWIQNQLLNYGKKVIITEATIREALRLDDAESIDCLPNEEIFTELSRMGLVRNVDSSTKFYMYLRFLQLMIRTQVGDLSSHTTKYSSLALTQKVFSNMKRVEKGFFGVDTPLFEGMIVAQQADDVADEGAAGVDVDVVPAAVNEPSIPSPTPTTQPPPPSQDLPSTSQVLPTPPPSPIAQPASPQQQPQPSHDAKILMGLLHTLLETCTTLKKRVEHLEQDKISQTSEITKLKQRVKKLERRNKLKVSKLRRLKKVGTAQRVDTSKDTAIDDDVTAVEKDAEIEENADVQGRQ